MTKDQMMAACAIDTDAIEWKRLGMKTWREITELEKVEYDRLLLDLISKYPLLSLADIRKSQSIKWEY